MTSFGGARVGIPRWSPDGQRIAFDSTKGGQSEVYVVDADGGAPIRFTSGTLDNVRPSWSNDGRWIYFGSIRTGAWQAWKAPIEGGQAVQVTKNGGREAFESRDGKSVYYSKFGIPPVAGIWRVAVGVGKETPVLEQGTQGNWALLDDGICLLDPVATFPSSSSSALPHKRSRQSQQCQEDRSRKAALVGCLPRWTMASLRSERSRRE